MSAVARNLVLSALVVSRQSNGPYARIRCIQKHPKVGIGEMHSIALWSTLFLCRLCEHQPVSVQIHDVELRHAVLLRAKLTRYLHSRNRQGLFV